ncbi:MAG: Cd(II)/Pb(II)-responsive transcriptional regulator [Neisseria sp.]|nr:Cd(II)/Pb(II)-responsive transcriptional regulator [Neisseria sp.]
MKISELARITETSTDTIRYYEREKLIPAAQRRSNNYRHYSEQHLEQLVFIRHCRSLDMSLDEIRLLLDFQARPQENCHAVNRVVDEHIEHVRHRIASLQKLEQQLTRLRSLCMAEGGHCPILAELKQSGSLSGNDNAPACLHTHQAHGLL